MNPDRWLVLAFEAALLADKTSKMSAAASDISTVGGLRLIGLIDGTTGIFRAQTQSAG